MKTRKATPPNDNKTKKANRCCQKRKEQALQPWAPLAVGHDQPDGVIKYKREKSAGTAAVARVRAQRPSCIWSLLW
ncbi:hypothetical protein N9L19_00335 [bacterium]|nr:hypothetical protein [bacterium]